MKQCYPFFMLLSLLFTTACSQGYKLERGSYGDYAAGQHAKFLRETEKAANYYDSALKQDPKNEFILQEAFSLAIMDGRFKRAISLAQELEDIGAENGSAALLLSLDALKRKKLDEVDGHLVNAKGSGFDGLVAPIVRAWVLAEKGQVDEAIAALAPLSEVPLFEAFRQDNMALIYDYAERFDEAEAAYFKIVTGNTPITVHHILFLGNMYMRSNQMEKAEVLYSRFNGRWPDNRRLDAAIKNLPTKATVRPSPEEALAHSLLRAASEIAADNTYAPAILYARMSSFMAPKREDTYLLLSNLFVAQEQPEAALRAIRRVDESSIFSDLARVREAFIYNNMGKKDEAVALLENYLKKHPDDISVRSSLGDIYQFNEQFDKALINYNRAISEKQQLSQNDWYLVFSRGISYERLNEWEKAETDFMKALSLKPNEPQVLNYLGYSWVDRGIKLEEAHRLIERAVLQRPKDGSIIDSLGWVLYLMGKYDEAVEQLERAVELSPSDPLLNEHLGDAYWMVGRKIEARFQWRHALASGAKTEQIPVLEDKIRLGLTITQALDADAQNVTQD